MKLSNNAGDYVTLKIDAYEFPKDDTDNWLLINGKVSLAGKSWTFRDPSLETYEVQRLIKWLVKIADDLPSATGIGFTEPNLEFIIIEEKFIRIYFELEARPPWAPCDGAGMEDLFIDLEHNPQELRIAALNLKEMLGNFPVRR